MSSSREIARYSSDELLASLRNSVEAIRCLDAAGLERATSAQRSILEVVQKECSLGDGRVDSLPWTDRDRSALAHQLTLLDRLLTRSRRTLNALHFSGMPEASSYSAMSRMR